MGSKRGDCPRRRRLDVGGRRDLHRFDPRTGLPTTAAAAEVEPAQKLLVPGMVSSGAARTSWRCSGHRDGWLLLHDHIQLRHLVLRRSASPLYVTRELLSQCSMEIGGSGGEATRGLCKDSRPETDKERVNGVARDSTRRTLRGPNLDDHYGPAASPPTRGSPTPPVLV
ncbi:hypothetical protein BHE74_00041437 [Ensete ventricosum]|nr:hypothetical protein BHE74_00041437 [Ensete ventricosum]RZS21287.1 hypothetical protein BHM03_00053903 [Ensete ventricosum]